MTTAQRIDDNQGARLQEIGQEMKLRGRQLYLAGLGAVGSVGEMGWNLTQELVERGRKLEKDERPAISERLKEGRERVASLGREAEERFEKRMSTTLQRFGVPSRKDVHDLIERIEQLTRKVESLSARG